MPTFEVKDHSEVAKLVCFSTGKLNPQVKEKLDFKCHCVQDGTTSKSKTERRKRVVKTKVGDIEYSGQNYGLSSGFATDTCDYYVAIHRKGADKVQIVGADLFRLMPQIAEDVTEEKEKEETSYKEKRLNLISQFGSGQLQRKIKQSLKSQLDENMVASTTASVVSKYKSQTLAQDEKSESTPTSTATPTTAATPTSGPNTASAPMDSGIVPPYNKYATQPQDVYLLETIIPAWVVNPLLEQSDVFMSCTPSNIAEWRQNNEYFGVVLDLLEDLPSNQGERHMQCAYIMYLNCLIHAYHLKVHEFRKRMGVYPDSWKGMVKKLLDDNFVMQSKDSKGKLVRCRPNQRKDLNLSHILVLYMRLKNYLIPLTPLADDLKLNIKRLSLHAQILGFTLGRSNQNASMQTATLSLPLKFPQPKKMKAGQRR